MSNRLDQQREARLEPKRIETCKKALEEMGFKVTQEHVQLNFMFKGSKIQFWPYSGWHTGKTITDGRGFQNLVKQLKDDRPRIVFNPSRFNGGLDFSPESIKETEIVKSIVVGADYATGKSISTITYFHLSRNWLHHKYLLFRLKHKENHVVVRRSVFEQSYPLKPDINKSLPKE